MEWTDEGILGRVRFLDRVWRACEPLAGAARRVSLERLPEINGPAQREIVRSVHQALKSGSDETASRRFHYNTTLARLDELTNALTKFLAQGGSHDDPAVLYAVHMLPLILAPFAPHIADELWERMGYAESIHTHRWPAADAQALVAEKIVLVVQVNGKVRARIDTAPGLDEDSALALALAHPSIQSHLAGKTPRQRIYVKDKLLNLVA